MKDAIDSMPAERVVESDGFANRKLIRPSLNRTDNRSDHNHTPSPMAERRDRPERPERAERQERNDRSDRGGSNVARKPSPPEQTNAENFYYQKQMQAKTPMVIVLRDGEEIHGMIEWYDKSCLKVSRNGQTNLLVYKPAIKYMYKEGENGRK
jgi:host factor-I protein